MRLKVSGTLANPVITNIETGEVLDGVEEVEVRAGGSRYLRKLTLKISEVSIDLDYEGDPDAIMTQDGKYAHSKLSQIKGLIWRS